MIGKAVSSLTDDELIADYVATARTWGDYCQSAEIRRANRIVPRLVNLAEELKSRGPATRLKLAPLLDDPDPGIRYCVAGRLEDLMPERCRATLERIWLSGLVGLSLSAGMRLGWAELRLGDRSPDGNGRS
jgi:hypothetical protein